MTFKKKFSALLAAGSIGLAGGTFGAVTPVAVAQEQNQELVNAAAPVSLTINKKLGDPTEVNYQGLPGLEGVQFKIERIDGVDLTTNAGWGELAGMTASDLAGNSAVDIGTISTDGNGVATISTGSNPEFRVGVYRVTEIQKQGFSVAPPFLITLPHSGENGNWEYEQSVYPKNQSVAPDKTVEDTNATIGSNLTYVINAPVPAGSMDRFNIVDPLVENLELQSDPAAVVTANGVDLVPSDYTVSYANNTLTVSFTRAGLDKLEEARKTNPALQVHVEFQARVVSVPANGSISNTATVELPNGASVTTDADGTDTNTLFGNLEITKEGAEDGDLSGATFQLYQCVQDGEKWTVSGNALNMSTSETGGAVVQEVSTGANTDANHAIAQGYGIPIRSNSGDDSTQLNTYCVVETEAPNGYARNPEPQPVNVDLANRALTANVLNNKDSILGQLPATGAWGIILIFLIGLALLGRGLYTSYRDNKAHS